MDTADKLTEIQREDWEQLRDMFRKNWPENRIGYFVIDNYIQWTNKNVDFEDLEVWSLNDSWRANGTYILMDRYELFIYSLERSNDTLKRALNLIDWYRVRSISSFVDKNRSAVDEVIRRKKLNVDYDYGSYAYFMPKEEGFKLKIELPDGLYFKKLDKRAIDRIDELWPHQCDGSDILIYRLIEYNFNIGLYDENDELLGWCLRDQSGAHAMLQVENKHKRKGYATLLTKAMAKLMAEVGYDSHSSVLYDNIASSKTFLRVGFKHVGSIYWMGLSPPNRNALIEEDDI